MKVYFIIFLILVVLSVLINVFAAILEKKYKVKMQKIAEEKNN